MQISTLPVKYQQPWATNAAPTLINTIPNGTQIGTHDGYASFNDGYVPLNTTPVASGGIPPRIQDTNGILQIITAWQQFAQAGAIVLPYDSAFQTAVGGYPQGCVVASATTFGTWWFNTADNNTTNPDTGGAGWVNFSQQFAGLASLHVATATGGGTTTSTTFQSAGAALSITKKRASNSVLFVGQLFVHGDASSSPDGMLANMRVAQNASGSYAGLGNSVQVGAESGSALKIMDSAFLMVADNGALAQSYTARLEYASYDGSFVSQTYAALLALEWWT